MPLHVQCCSGIEVDRHGPRATGGIADLPLMSFWALLRREPLNQEILR